MTNAPGWEGRLGPFPHEYGRQHVYARDVHSGAGNCVCGRHLESPLHLQAAPGVPIPQPGAVTTAVQELRELTACRCNEAWTGRGLHDPSCASEYREDVETIVAALPQPGAVTLPASVVRALLPESQNESHEAALVARRAVTAIVGEQP